MKSKEKHIGVLLKQVLGEMRGIKRLKEKIKRMGEEMKEQRGNFCREMEELRREVRELKEKKERWMEERREMKGKMEDLERRGMGNERRGGEMEKGGGGRREDRRETKGNREAVTAFIDLKAAFDTVGRGVLGEAMRERGVREGLVRRVEEMFRETKSRVRVGENTGVVFWTARGG